MEIGHVVPFFPFTTSARIVLVHWLIGLCIITSLKADTCWDVGKTWTAQLGHDWSGVPTPQVTKVEMATYTAHLPMCGSLTIMPEMDVISCNHLLESITSHSM